MKKYRKNKKEASIPCSIIKVKTANKITQIIQTIRFPNLLSSEL